MPTTLNVTVTRVAYPPATSNGDWYILITNHGACKGKMAWRPQESEQLILDGEWAVYKGSREFAFKQARLDVPTDSREQLHYVCSRTNGLGPAAEQLIWDQVGIGWIDLESGLVPRMSGRVYANFQLQLEALREKSEEVKAIAALIGKGATMNMSCAAWEKWTKNMLGIVNADCYRLAELDGYGFRDVDKEVRKSYGIGDDDKRRIRAAVIYSLRRLTDRGDTIVQWDDLYTKTIGLLGGYAELITDCTSDLFEEGTLKAFPASEGVSLAEDWKAETTIWEYMERTDGQ